MKKETKKEEVKSGITLKESLAALRKKFGDDVVMTGDYAPGNIVFTPSGSFAVDDILGGGIPEGRIIECYGEASSGKSTLALFIAAQFQKQGKIIAFLDHENSYSEEYAQKLGIDTAAESFILFQPNTLEESFSIMMKLIEDKVIDLFIVDSVSAMVPKAEFESDDPLKATMALQARLLSPALRQMTNPLGKSKATVIFINQTRQSFELYGPKDLTPGGKALKFFSSIRIQVKKEKDDTGKFKGPKETILGNTLKIAAVKNKCAPPYRTGTIDLYFGTGIDLYNDAFAYGVEKEVITKTGNSYSFGDKKLGIGEKQGVASLKADPKLYEEVRKEIKKKLK